MRIVVTGAGGFIGRNLRLCLAELARHEVVPIARDTPENDLPGIVGGADFVIHLAGVNRPKDADGFAGNTDFTRSLCSVLGDKAVPVAYASSTQALLDNAYGASKRAAEEELLAYGRRTGAPIHIFRLTNVFGKWCRPNYNSAVATFCHNIARGLPIAVNDPNAPLRLVYIDDVVDAFVALLDSPRSAGGVHEAEPVRETTVGEVARMIESFRQSRDSLVTLPVGKGLARALYATYLSFLPPEEFAYDVPVHADPRGMFVEMLKTSDSGQVSFFTAKPGVTRGGHYHHTKTEKFLVISGVGRFGFRNVDTDETAELVVSGGGGRIVETVPGWAHDITNIGEGDLVCMLWANEIFDRAKPDTVAAKVLS